MLPEVVELVRATANQSTASQASAEQSFADLLEQVALALEQQGSVGVEKLLQSHPQHADRLRDLLPAMAAMASWARDPEAVATSEPALAAAEPVGGVLGDFRIIREIGRGGMGVVYEAEQISMRRRVALKVLSFAALVQEKSLQRFRNEVRAAAALDHPHIVSVYSIGEERGVHFYAMQLIRGQTLADLIGEMRTSGEERAASSEPSKSEIRNPKSEIDTFPVAHLSTLHAPPSSIAAFSREHCRSAARLGIQAAEALQHAHDQGVLHRDIKPSNLMLDGEGKLYIADFGLARIEADAGMTMTGDILGTLRYMAPEQALAKRVVIDHRADVYSLGATLYELITLQPAFAETDRSELLKQIAFEEPRPLRKLDRRVPAELETIVLKAIEKNPDARYQTAQQLADDLRAFLEHLPIKAKPPTIVNRIAKWSRRHVAFTWAAFVTLLIVTTALGISTLLVSRERSIAVAQLIETEKSRKRVDAHFRDSLHVLEALINYENSESHGNSPAVRSIQNASATEVQRFLRKFVVEESHDPQVWLHAGIAYVHLGRLHAATKNPKEAGESYRRASNVFRSLSLDDPSNTVAHMELMACEDILVRHFSDQGDDASVARHLQLFEDCVLCYLRIALPARTLEPGFVGVLAEGLSLSSRSSNVTPSEKFLRVLIHELVLYENMATESQTLLFCRGLARAKLGDANGASEDFDRAMALKSADLRALNSYAWTFATTSDENIRDGKRAVELAIKACELSDYKNAAILDTLAAAYAETADFESAIKWQEKAVDMAPGIGWGTQHLEAFRNGKPWRQGPNPAGR